jgi:hypothetical protein
MADWALRLASYLQELARTGGPAPLTLIRLAVRIMSPSKQQCLLDRDRACCAK